MSPTDRATRIRELARAYALEDTTICSLVVDLEVGNEALRAENEALRAEVARLKVARILLDAPSGNRPVVRYPFSMVDPASGMRFCVHRNSTWSVVAEVRSVNHSRAFLGKPLLRLLHRPTGKTWDVPADADNDTLAASIDASLESP